MSMPHGSQTPSRITWTNAPTRSVDVLGTTFVYRQLGAENGVPVIFLNHLAAELDRWDPRVVDGIVNGLAALSRGVSVAVGGIDKYLVDGIVNTIAAFIKRLMSPLLRAAQTGFTQNYALVMVLGLMVAVALFFAGDIAAALRRFFATVL